jgi:hypothetical protein
MPETIRFVGALGVVLLVLFGARFRAAMAWNNGLETLKSFNYLDSYHRRLLQRSYK